MRCPQASVFRHSRLAQLLCPEHHMRSQLSGKPTRLIKAPAKVGLSSGIARGSSNTSSCQASICPALHMHVSHAHACNASRTINISNLGVCWHALCPLQVGNPHRTRPILRTDFSNSLHLASCHIITRSPIDGISNTCQTQKCKCSVAMACNFNGLSLTASNREREACAWHDGFSNVTETTTM